jgi:Na+/H+-dicarboxylate symporter
MFEYRVTKYNPTLREADGAYRVGVPGGVSLLVTLPATFVSVGLPVEAIGLLLSVEALPDMFRTTANVSADMAATAVVGRHTKIPTPVAAVSSEA